MTDTLGAIRSKKLGATGFTETLLTKYADANSGSVVAVVELLVEEVHNKADGSRKVDFIINTVEPATSQRVEEALRELARAMYRDRPAVKGQEVLQGIESGPSPDEAADAATSLVERDDTGEATGVWEPDEPGSVSSTDGPWPGDPDYVAPDPEETSNVVSFSNS